MSWPLGIMILLVDLTYLFFGVLQKKAGRKMSFSKNIIFIRTFSFTVTIINGKRNRGQGKTWEIYI
jgi:hypothetical protein